MKKFENYLVDSLGKSNEDIRKLYEQMKSIVDYAMRAGLPRLEKKIGYYELLGFDIMIDDKLNPYLLEINSNPALFLDTQTQKETIPPILYKALDIVLHLNEDPEKISGRVRDIPQSALGSFEVIYNEARQ